MFDFSSPLGTSLPNSKIDGFKYVPFKEITLKTEKKKVANVEERRDLLSEHFCVTILFSSHQDLFEVYGTLPMGVEVIKADHQTVGTLLADTKDELDFFQNAALKNAQNTWLVRVMPGTKLDKPIRIIKTFVEENQAECESYLYQIGQGSVVEIFEERNSIESVFAASSNVFSNVIVKAGATSKLGWTVFQKYSPKTVAFTRDWIFGDKEAVVYVTPLSIGGKFVQSRMDLIAREPHVQFNVQGAVRTDQAQVIDHWINSRHDVSDTKSETHFWTVAADQSRVVFNSNIIISKNGFRTDAVQRNKNLLLSKRAIVDTVPKLEIACDDVKCAHGATVSPVSVEQVYYLEARGIDPKEAEKMIIEGFTFPVLSRISNETIRSEVQAQFSQKRGRE